MDLERLILRMETDIRDWNKSFDNAEKRVSELAKKVQNANKDMKIKVQIDVPKQDEMVRMATAFAKSLTDGYKTAFQSSFRSVENVIRQSMSNMQIHVPSNVFRFSNIQIPLSTFTLPTISVPLSSIDVPKDLKVKVGVKYNMEGVRNLVSQVQAAKAQKNWPHATVPVYFGKPSVRGLNEHLREIKKNIQEKLADGKHPLRSIPIPTKIVPPKLTEINEFSSKLRSTFKQLKAIEVPVKLAKPLKLSDLNDYITSLQFKGLTPFQIPVKFAKIDVKELNTQIAAIQGKVLPITIPVQYGYPTTPPGTPGLGGDGGGVPPSPPKGKGGGSGRGRGKGSGSGERKGATSLQGLLMMGGMGAAGMSALFAPDLLPYIIGSGAIAAGGYAAKNFLYNRFPQLAQPFHSVNVLNLARQGWGYARQIPSLAWQGIRATGGYLGDAARAGYGHMQTGLGMLRPLGSSLATGARAFGGGLMDLGASALGGLRSAINALGGTALTATAALSALGLVLATQVARRAITLGAQYQDTLVGFEVMSGSRLQGHKLAEDITKLAVATPYQTEGLTEVARMMAGRGVSTENILPTLKALGDVTAGVGGGQDKLWHMAKAYADVLVRGRLQGEEERQFANVGVGVADFAQVMGITTARFKEMMKEGKIGADIVTKAFNKMTSEGGRFYNLQLKLAEKARGQWNALQETFDVFLRDVGMEFLDGILKTGLLKDLTAELEKLKTDAPYYAESVANFAKEIKDFVDAIIVAAPFVKKAGSEIAEGIAALMGMDKERLSKDFKTGLALTPGRVSDEFYNIRGTLYGKAGLAPQNTLNPISMFLKTMMTNEELIAQARQDFAKTNREKEAWDALQDSLKGATNQGIAFSKILEDIGKIQLPTKRFSQEIQEWFDDSAREFAEEGRPADRSNYFLRELRRAEEMTRTAQSIRNVLDSFDIIGNAFQPTTPDVQNKQRQESANRLNRKLFDKFGGDAEASNAAARETQKMMDASFEMWKSSGTLTQMKGGVNLGIKMLDAALQTYSGGKAHPWLFSDLAGIGGKKAGGFFGQFLEQPVSPEQANFMAFNKFMEKYNRVKGYLELKTPSAVYAGTQEFADAVAKANSNPQLTLKQLIERVSELDLQLQKEQIELQKKTNDILREIGPVAGKGI